MAIGHWCQVLEALILIGEFIEDSPLFFCSHTITAVILNDQRQVEMFVIYSDIANYHHGDIIKTTKQTTTIKKEDKDMTNTIIRNFVVRDRHFVIVQNEDGFYLAIEDKYITDGKLNKALNGFQMYASKELETCLNTCKNQVELEYLEEQGHSKAEAFGIVFGLPQEALETLIKAGAFA